MFKLTPKEQKLVILLGCLLVVGMVLRFTLPDKEDLEVVKGQEGDRDSTAGLIEASAEGNESGSADINDEILVHVAGAVVNPGVYSLEEGARLYHALEKAGGQLGEAALDQVNLAQPLYDGQQVYIPRPYSGESGEFSTPGGALFAAAEGKININMADKAELETLPGIGTVKAQSILSYREKEGPFREVEELLKVSGIGDKTLESIIELVTIY